MKNIIRFKRPDQEAHTEACFKHVSRRSIERFGASIDQFEHCQLVDQIQQGIIKSLGRISTFQFWVRFKLNGKNCYAVYNEAFEVLQTVYTPKMFESKRRSLAA